jgi:hypothetical protein
MRTIDYTIVAGLHAAARRERARAIAQLFRRLFHAGGAALARMGTSPRGSHVQGRAAQG